MGKFATKLQLDWRSKDGTLQNVTHNPLLFFITGDEATPYQWHQTQVPQYTHTSFHQDLKYPGDLCLYLPSYSPQQLTDQRVLSENSFSTNPPQTFNYNGVYNPTSSTFFETPNDVPKQVATSIPPSVTSHYHIQETLHIRNVVCNFSLPMHIDLHKVARTVWNCAYFPYATVLTKSMRNPSCYIRVYSSGKVYIVGCKNEIESRAASRKIGRQIQKAMDCKNEQICIQDYRISNILATCRLPFGIKVPEMARQYSRECEYEPELTVGAVWRAQNPRAIMRIHTTGTISIAGATSKADIITAIKKIYPIMAAFRCNPNIEQTTKLINNNSRKRSYPTNSLQDVTFDPIFFVKRHRGRNAHAIQLHEDDYNDLIECPEFFDVESDC